MVTVTYAQLLADALVVFGCIVGVPAILVWVLSK